jgi:hypothetical protein
MWNEALREFNGVAGGKMRPLGTGKARELRIVLEVDAWSSGALY